MPVAVLLTAVFPGLTVADRWLHIQGVVDLGRELWCRAEVLCNSALPSYAGVGVVCSLAGILLLLLLRKGPKMPEPPSGPESAAGPATAGSARLQRVGRLLRVAALAGFVVTLVAGLRGMDRPGLWYLTVVAAYTLGCMLDATDADDMRRRLRSLAPALAVQVCALLGVLYMLGGDFASRPVYWLVGLLLLVPLGIHLLQRKPIGAGFWIAAGVIVLYAQGINSWRYAIIGDEYIFQEHARSLLDPQGWTLLAQRFFDGQGVYGTHPFFSTVIQAVFMRLLGTGSYGWRISNAVAIALSAAAFLDFLLCFLPRRTAIVGAVLLASSHYLIDFSKIGYNNVQALLAATLVLAAGARAARSRRSLPFTLLGLAMGACLYVYPAALYALPLGFLLPWIAAAPGQKPSLRNWAAALAAFSVLLLPLALQAEYWQTKVAGTVFFSPALVASAGGLLAHLGSNLLYTLLSPAYIIEETHFVVSSFVDPLTAAFIPIGLGLCLKSLRSSRRARFLLVTFLLEAVLVGATHDRQFPPVTRMFLLLPWWTSLAAIGIDALAEWVRSHAWRRAVIVATVCAALGLNLYQAYVLFPERFESRASMEVLFQRLLERDEISDPSHPKTYFFLTDSTWGIDGMRTMQVVYHLPRSPELLMRADITDSPLTGAMADALADPRTAVILQPTMDPDLMRALGNRLRTLGKFECTVREAAGTDVRFSLWLSPEMAALCRTANPIGASIERFSAARVPVSSWALLLLALVLVYWRRRLGTRLDSHMSGAQGLPGPRTGVRLRPRDWLNRIRPAHRQSFDTQGPSEVTFRVARGARLRLTMRTPAGSTIEKSPPAAGSESVVFEVGPDTDKAEPRASAEPSE